MSGQILRFWADILPERIKQYPIRHAILMLLPVIMVLSGCQSNMQAESSQTAQDAASDKDKTPEPDLLADSEDFDDREIYEDFLGGRLTTELEGQQVCIDELFWSNDIEYCFWDIDDDGCDELHVRDDTIYYAVKIQDETPEIIFEGWWQYEPVAADGLCGILRSSSQYGSGDLEFIRMNADGSQESDGWMHWSDQNKNGIIDGEDFFIGCENADQYFQFLNQYTAMQEKNKLKWAGRQLKQFDTWQEAYVDFIQKIHITIPLPEPKFEYLLIYVDADYIPELYIYTGGMASGELIVSFYDGKVRALNRGRVGIQYLKHGGLLYGETGAMGFYPSNVYQLEKGEFSEIGTGWYTDGIDDQGNMYFEYYWEDVPVTEEQFEASINELIDTSKCVIPDMLDSMLYSEDEILAILNVTPNERLNK